MQIHEIVYYSRLQEILDSIYDDLTPNVDKFNVSQHGFINCLVMFLVQPNSISKIQRGLYDHRLASRTQIKEPHLFRILSNIIWRRYFDIKNITQHQLFIIA